MDSDIELDLENEEEEEEEDHEEGEEEELEEAEEDDGDKFDAEPALSVEGDRKSKIVNTDSATPQIILEKPIVRAPAKPSCRPDLQAGQPLAAPARIVPKPSTFCDSKAVTSSAAPDQIASCSDQKLAEALQQEENNTEKQRQKQQKLDENFAARERQKIVEDLQAKRAKILSQIQSLQHQLLTYSITICLLLIC